MGADAYFKSRFTSTSSRNVFWRLFCQWLNKKFISNDSIVLDVGAGYCNFINNISAREKHALDQSPEIKKYAGTGVHVHIQKSIELGNLPKNHFNVVFASNFFEHLSENELPATMNILRKVMKQNSLLIALQPNYYYSYRNYFDDYTHKKVFSHESFRDFLTANGFEIIYEKRKFLPFSFKSRFPKPTFLMQLYLSLPFKPFAKQMFFVARKRD